MRAFVRNHKKTAIVIGLVVLVVVILEAWSLTAPLRGQMAARFDLRHGHYAVLAYGLPPLDRPEYARLLRERYGIEVRTVAGCVVTDTLVSYIDAYNAVSVAEANRKFGHDVFKECEEDAGKNWEPRKAVTAVNP